MNRVDLNIILSDKAGKPKDKAESISQLLLKKKIGAKDLAAFAKTCKDPGKATCVEALEFATKENPEIAGSAGLKFATECLAEKAPRIKWEAARLIGNIAHLHPGKLDQAIKNLLENSEHSGTVVRWSTAFALGEILRTTDKNVKSLIPAVEAICRREQQNSIRKIYLAALKRKSNNG
jgi:HEAT repeat protein